MIGRVRPAPGSSTGLKHCSLPGTTSENAELQAARRLIAELEAEVAIHRRAAELLGQVVDPKWLRGDRGDGLSEAASPTGLPGTRRRRVWLLQMALKATLGPATAPCLTHRADPGQAATAPSTRRTDRTCRSSPTRSAGSCGSPHRCRRPPRRGSRRGHGIIDDLTDAEIPAAPDTATRAPGRRSPFRSGGDGSIQTPAAIARSRATRGTSTPPTPAAAAPLCGSTSS